jgi:hypothetical protein
MLVSAALAVALISAPHTYAATPVLAARQALFAPDNRHVVAVRTNVSGRYATVLLRGAVMEGAAIDAPMLLKRFTFGWQPLDLLNFQCALDAQHLSAATTAALMRGMPKPKNDRPCKGVTRDTGQADEVSAVRELMRGPLVPWVIVADDYALGEWYGAGGGETVYQKRGNRWIRIAGGGGEMEAEILRKHGVPERVSCALGVRGAKC